ncbi:prolipoprotein diacylglyceryl transferase [bacterium]|nr:prolipoprotein diacylglyceryl transferase [bacterium]
MESTHYWIHTLNPVLLPLWGPLAIRYYGLAYLTAFLIGYLLLKKFQKKGRLPLDNDQLSWMLWSLILGTFIGGRLGYIILYALPQTLNDPGLILKIWEGGMASHGGFIGVLIAVLILAKRFRIPALKLADMISTLVPPGLLLGRIANFINGELWGKITSVPWAVIFPQSMPAGTPITAVLPRHPSQIYEALLEGLVLLIWTQWRCFKTNALNSPGRLSGEFLIAYTLLRLLGEQFREPDAALILGLSRGVFYSVFLLLLGAWFYRQSFLPHKNRITL